MYKLETCLWVPMTTDRGIQEFANPKDALPRLREIKQHWESLKGVECFLTDGDTCGYPRLDVYLRHKVHDAMICVMCVYVVLVKEEETDSCGN